MASGNVEVPPTSTQQQTTTPLDQQQQQQPQQMAPSDALTVPREISFTPLDEFLGRPLSEVAYKIPRFRSRPLPLVVSHTETIGDVVKKLNEYRVRCAVVARYKGRCGLNCSRAGERRRPEGPMVIVKQQMFYTLSIHYSFFDVRVCNHSPITADGVLKIEIHVYSLTLEIII